MATLYTNGRFLDNGDGFTNSLLCRDGLIVAVPEDSTQAEKLEAANVVDLKGRLVLPAFVDAHCHLLMLGQSLEKVDLRNCASLDDILDRLRAYDRQHPDVPRILAHNWQQGMTTPEQIDRRFFDEFTDKPVYIESSDLHSGLCNTAALREMQVDQHTPNQPGGFIVRDANDPSRITGWLQEMAHLQGVAPRLNALARPEDKERAMDRALDALLAAGYTGVADLLTEEETFAMLESRVKSKGRLPIRVRCFWHCAPQDTTEAALEQVERAKALQERWKGNEWLQVNGIKLVTDGVIDSCTASLCLPYQNGQNAEPLWPLERMMPVVQKADALGLQCAIHAIGDQAVHIATTALAGLGAERIALHRHRIEHLELSQADDAERIGALGITTSVQPVHCDPAVMPNWYTQLGGDSSVEQHPAGHRCNRAFAYNDFLQRGAPLAIGTDAPTAPYGPLPNLHIATTRASALDPSIAWRTNPSQALPLLAAVRAATLGAARACHLDALQGDFTIGKAADFNVLDIDIFQTDDYATAKTPPRTLLRAVVAETYQAGNLVIRQ